MIQISIKSEDVTLHHWNIYTNVTANRNSTSKPGSYATKYGCHFYLNTLYDACSNGTKWSHDKHANCARHTNRHIYTETHIKAPTRLKIQRRLGHKAMVMACITGAQVLRCCKECPSKTSDFSENAMKCWLANDSYACKHSDTSI